MRCLANAATAVQKVAQSAQAMLFQLTDTAESAVKYLESHAYRARVVSARCAIRSLKQFWSMELVSIVVKLMVKGVNSAIM